MFPNRLDFIIDGPFLNEILSGGKEISDLTQIGRMRDIYPIKFFSLGNVNTLIAREEWGCVLLFLPFVLWLAATNNKIYTPEARLFMLKVAFEIIRRFYNMISIPKNCYSELVGEVSSDKPFITVLQRSRAVRLLVSLATLIT